MDDLFLESRRELVSKIRKELLGPGSEYAIPDEDHELITDLPEVRYSVGILFPQKNLINADNNEIPTVVEGDSEEIEDFFEETDETDDEQGQAMYGGNGSDDTDSETLDENIGLSMQNMPSSMGVTFFISGNVKQLLFDLSFATYRHAKLGDCQVPFSPGEQAFVLPEDVSNIVEYSNDTGTLALRSPLTRRQVNEIRERDRVDDPDLLDCLFRLSNQFQKGFVREPHNLQINVQFEPGKDLYETRNIGGDPLKFVVLLKKTTDGVSAITAMLVNTNTGGYNGTNSIFQPRICVDTKVNNTGVSFHAYTSRNHGRTNDIEERSLELLYRDKKVYATGHGVSADWNVDNSGKGAVWTEFMPTFEVPQVDFNVKDIESRIFSMKYLSDLDSTDRDTKIGDLKTLVDSYARWVSALREREKSLKAEYRDVLQQHVRGCEESLNRMYYGLQLLSNTEDGKIFNAFQLANRAMFMQRIHAAFQREDHYPGDIELQNRMSNLNYASIDDSDHKWRPFQLAFLLMSLRSIVEDTCVERDLVDLIWFPTGGGKTEAYLGLTAFTIFFRRLTYTNASSGTTVIMRYTLRLLAAQQYLRAATLICACESIRKDASRRRPKYASYALGKDKITIGLWIGSTHTPNRNDEAQRFVNKLHQTTRNDLKDVKDKYNKFQILKCPWCGTKLVRDLNPTGTGLVGSWGYSMRDKKHFQLNCPQENCEFEVSLPLQVVDEELYASPPTLLFGTVDKFAMLPWKNDSGSFFATAGRNRPPELIIQDELHLISGPLGTMVGLYETAIDELCSLQGTRPKIVASTATIRRAKDQCSNLFNREVRQFPAPGVDSNDTYFAREADRDDKPGRLYVGVMPSGKTKAMMEIRAIAAVLQRVHMMDVPFEVKDKYWTLAVYFNSLRDLSKCMTLVDDDVKDFLRRMAQRFGRRNLTRQIGSATELTSRVSTSQLNETLERLEQLEYSKENQENKKYPINVLLATNMISVGVDVARLNLMLLVGQPKLTSEYIQASSRIGRTYPGVAFMLYDGSKSRDRSHYEQFRGYHESFYKYVEPTGATPFSKPARDRALHAVMVSLMRHKYGLSQDKEAALFQTDIPAVNRIENSILTRASDIRKRASIELQDESDDIMHEMNKFWDAWETRANLANGNFYYGDKFIVSDPPSDTKRLLKVYGNQSADPAKETLTSMRNVDKNVIAGLLIWE